MDEYLMHFGRSVRDGAPGRGSGRYPLGSGEHPQSPNNPIARLRANRADRRERETRVSSAIQNHRSQLEDALANPSKYTANDLNEMANKIGAIERTYGSLERIGGSNDRMSRGRGRTMEVLNNIGTVGKAATSTILLYNIGATVTNTVLKRDALPTLKVKK